MKTIIVGIIILIGLGVYVGVSNKKSSIEDLKPLQLIMKKQLQKDIAIEDASAYRRELDIANETIVGFKTRLKEIAKAEQKLPKTEKTEALSGVRPDERDSNFLKAELEGARNDLKKAKAELEKLHDNSGKTVKVPVYYEDDYWERRHRNSRRHRKYLKPRRGSVEDTATSLTDPDNISISESSYKSRPRRYKKSGKYRNRYDNYRVSYETKFAIDSKNYSQVFHDAREKIEAAEDLVEQLQEELTQQLAKEKKNSALAEEHKKRNEIIEAENKKIKEKHYALTNERQKIEKKLAAAELTAADLEKKILAADEKNSTNQLHGKFADKLSLIQAHIYCAAFDSGKLFKKVLEIARDSSAEDLEEFEKYLLLNHRDLWEKTRSRDYRKLRGKLYSGLQMKYHNGRIIFEQTSDIDFAYETILGKYKSE